MLRGRGGIPEDYAIAFLPLILFMFILHGSRFFMKGGERRMRIFRVASMRRGIRVPSGDIWKWAFIACIAWAIGACAWIYFTGQSPTGSG